MAPNIGEERFTLSSWGLGSRLQWQRLNLDLVLTKRLNYPGFENGSGSSLQDLRVHLQIGYKF